MMHGSLRGFDVQVNVLTNEGIIDGDGEARKFSSFSLTPLSTRSY